MTARVALAAALALGLTDCSRPAEAPKPPATPLSAADQRASADRLAAAFAGACLTETDPKAAMAGLRAAGWPAFKTIWGDPGGSFYASPMGSTALYVLGQQPFGDVPGAQQIACVGHYPAETADAMASAIARRWGPGRSSNNPYPGALIWTFRMKGAVLTPTSRSRGISPEEAAHLAPGEADVFVQVSYVAAQHDAASIIAVSRPTR